MTYDRRPWGLYVVAASVYAFLFAPIVFVVVNSFNADASRVHWGGATLDWYADAWTDETVIEAAKTSLLIATLVMLASTALGASTALALRRSRRWTRGLIQSTTYARLIIPELVLALALLILFTRLGLSRGTGTVVLGQVVFNSAFVTVIVGARLAGRDPATEEAARDLGATAFRAFRRVTLPEILPAIIAGALIAFTFSLDNVVTTFFLGGSTNTLPLVILSLIRFQVSPVVNALGTSLIVVNTFALIAFLILGRGWSAAAHRRTEAPMGA